MIPRILLLLSLTCCVCGSFNVNTSQSFYEAEENKSVTLEWTFPADSSLRSLNVYCAKFKGDQHPCVFRLYHGVEVRRSQHRQFAGRVHCDRKVLKEGRLRLHLSPLHVNDSGRYECEVMTAFGADTGHCQLSVTATRVQSQTGVQIEAVINGRKIQGQSGPFIALTLLLAMLLVWLLVRCLKRRCCSTRRTEDVTGK